MATTATNPRRFLLTAQEAADMLRVSRGTVYGMANAGRLPAVRIGCQLRFRPEELEAWVDEQRWFAGGLREE